jgi:hypothetical protein
MEVKRIMDVKRIPKGKISADSKQYHYDWTVRLLLRKSILVYFKTICVTLVDK